MEGKIPLKEISASVLGADLMRLGEEIEKMKQLGVRWLHLDHMDGHFVPNISFGPAFVEAIRSESDLFLDVHLMFTNPMQYIDAYAKTGADLICVHAECNDDVREVLKKIASYGIKTGVSIKPGTPVEALEGVLDLCDQVLVMTVEPGFGGQGLREDCVAKIPSLRKMIEKTGREIIIEVDGGVKAENAARIFAAGADVLVIGTGLFRAEDPAAVLAAAYAGETQA